MSVLSPKCSTSVHFVSTPGKEEGGEGGGADVNTTYQVVLVGLGLEVLLCSLDEDDDVAEGANCVLRRDGEVMREADNLHFEQLLRDIDAS